MFLPNKKFDSYQNVTTQFLQSIGIQAVIYDIDETLAPRGIATPTEQVVNYLKTLEKEFPIVFMSNNGVKRVKGYNQSFGYPIFPNAKKPLKKTYLKIIKYLNLPPQKIAMVGDQLFTDIAGGNRAGLYTILVNPVKQHYGWFYKSKHFFEKMILKGYKE